MSKRVLILSHDKIGAKMAGPGIRYHNLAKELSKYFEVTVGVYNPEHQYKTREYVCKHVDMHKFHNYFRDADVIIALWMSDEMINFSKQNGKLLIFDLYAPVPAEVLVNKYFSGKNLSVADDEEYANLLEQYKKFFKFGDLFLCSNYRQKDLWAGFAFASSAVILSSYDLRPLHSRIIEAPMGIDSHEPVHKKNVLRGVIPGVQEDDFVVVWTGGIWDWFDGQTVVRAMGKIKNPNIKLVFLGTKNPNPEVPLMSETKSTVMLAKKLKLLNKNVFFLDGWLGYEERIDYLLEADAAIYAHKDSIEARYSHRTRCLDHIYARIPTIATKGDYFAEIIENDCLGEVVEIGDFEMMARALEITASSQNQKYLNNINRIRESFFWENTQMELVEWIKDSYRPYNMLPPQGDFSSQAPVSNRFRMIKKIAKTPYYAIKYPGSLSVATKHLVKKPTKPRHALHETRKYIHSANTLEKGKRNEINKTV